MSKPFNIENIVQALDFSVIPDVPHGDPHAFRDFDANLPDDQREILSEFGVFTGYGDSFAYRGHGVMVVGEEAMGKTSLIRELAERDAKRMKVLGEDYLLAYQQPDDPSGKCLLYPLPSEVDTGSHKAALRKGLGTFVNRRGYPLELILHIKESRRIADLRPGNRDVLSRYLFTRTVGQKLSQVPMWELPMPYLKSTTQLAVGSNKIRRQLESMFPNSISPQKIPLH